MSYQGYKQEYYQANKERIKANARTYYHTHKEEDRLKHKARRERKRLENYIPIESLEGEIWKPVVGFEGLYEISNKGRVISLNYQKTHLPKLMKLDHLVGGYVVVNLSKNGKRYDKKVHRLVAEAFIPNPNNLPTVNHCNEVKTDNRPENLEWCTDKYNLTYGTARERTAIHKQKPVIRISDTEEIEFESASTAAELITGSRRDGTSITACCKGRRQSAYGYKWKYKKAS